MPQLRRAARRVQRLPFSSRLSLAVSRLAAARIDAWNSAVDAYRVSDAAGVSNWDARVVEFEVELAAAGKRLAELMEQGEALATVAAALERERDLAMVRTERLVGLETDLAAARAELAEQSMVVAAEARAAQEEALAVLLKDIGARADLVLRRIGEASDAAEERLALLAANVVGLGARQDEAFNTLRQRLAGTGGDPATERYLDLLEATLTGTVHEDGSTAPWASGAQDPARRAVGRDWPETAESMIGTARMRHLRLLAQRALAEGVPGDFIETGVWRGGACIYLRGILAAAGDLDRRVFVADSFRGLPPPDAAAYPADACDEHHAQPQLAVSRAEVEANFRRYGLLDEQVVFLEGWFKDTLPTAPVERLALLRLDGDLYESTIDALNSLYPKVSPGGFVIVDDYILPACAQAVDDFRARQGISAPLHDIDGAAVWWQIPDMG